MIYSSIKKLVAYGLETGLVPEEEEIYTTNMLLDVLKLDDFEDDGETYSHVLVVRQFQCVEGRTQKLS